MNQETFKKLSLEKQVELYNQWLTDIKMEEYTLYPNDNGGLETLLETQFYTYPTADIIEIIATTPRYDVSDSVVTFDYTDGFHSLTEEEIKERFENKDFLDWLDGQRLGDYNAI